MIESYDAIVIGAGSTGSAAAYYLARDGCRTLLLEQFEIGHARGSSHGESRVFRLAYDRLDYARLAVQCRPLWHALEVEAGERLLIDCDQLDLAEDEAHRHSLLAIADTLARIGAGCEPLDAAAIRQRYPQWRLGEAATAILSTHSGILRAGRCVQVLVARATSHGATVRDREPVTNIAADPGWEGVEVTTSVSRYRARKLIIAGGAWINDLLAYVGVHLALTVTREQSVYFRPRANPAQFALGRFPIFMHWRAPNFGYGFPIVGVDGLKVGFHHGGDATDPGSDRSPRTEVTASLLAYLQRYLPDAAGEAFDPVTCLYTNTPDENFVIGFAPGLPGVVFCSACSGHGFKFAIGLGRALADLAQHGTTGMSIDHTRWRAPEELR
jgi:sarcosine oxidase